MGRQEFRYMDFEFIRSFGVKPMSSVNGSLLKLGTMLAQCFQAAAYDIFRPCTIQSKGWDMKGAQRQDSGHVGEVPSEHRQVESPCKP